MSFSGESLQEGKEGPALGLVERSERGCGDRMAIAGDRADQIVAESGQAEDQPAAVGPIGAAATATSPKPR